MRIVKTALTLGCLALVACGPPADVAEEGVELVSSRKFLRSDHAVANQYIVVFNDEGPGMNVLGLAGEHAARHGGEVFRVYQHALKGYAARMDEARARALANDPRVKYVEEDGVVYANATQSPATWGLDRVDQRDLPLSNSYTYNNNGSGVHAYIIDTGIRRTHNEFGGRAYVGTDTIGDGQNSNDCNGHGTHVAGTVGGSTYGMAKGVTLYAVRVLDCQGSGTNSGVIQGVDWVTANHVKPAVANMSLGGGAAQALDDAVTNSINAGVVYALAGGNESTDACTRSPARTPSAITVGATESSDARASYSNFGTCLDLFAPGSSITSAWNTSDSATNTISGTSMATPHVAGAAALYLAANTSATPAQVRDALVNNSTPNKVTSPGSGSPTSGQAVSGTTTLSATASDNVGVTQVEFLVDGAVVGFDATSPYSISWDSTTVGNGSHSVVSRAYDAAGNQGTSTAVSFTVNNPGQAAYDATLKVPKCATVGSVCNTGTLVQGRGTLGPEANAPNTLNNSCADGSSGTYQSDESVEAVKVYTSDGTSFAPGKTVTVEVKVWAYSSYSSDYLDLYYAADASSPSWTLIATRQPTASGLQTLTATYTLPSGGSVQAVRAAFRYSGSAGACSTGSYNDRDDLAFAVGGGGGGGDTTPPTTSVTAPSAGATVSGTVTVSASASDNVGVTRVEFYDGTTLIGSDTTSPYSVSWNTAAVANGSHTLTSKAFDAAGNSGTSAGVTVTVSNGASCGTSSQLLANPGFESGDVSWTSYGVIENGTAYAARTGSWKAWLNGYGIAWTDPLYQQISIPAAACTAQLVFWLRVDSEETTTTTAYDTLAVTVKNSSGTTLATLATYSNLNESTGYVQKTFDLAAYRGQTIRIHFEGTEDSSLATSFLIDDTAVNVTQ